MSNLLKFDWLFYFLLHARGNRKEVFWFNPFKHKDKISTQIPIFSIVQVWMSCCRQCIHYRFRSFKAFRICTKLDSICGSIANKTQKADSMSGNSIIATCLAFKIFDEFLPFSSQKRRECIIHTWGSFECRCTCLATNADLQSRKKINALLIMYKFLSDYIL